jgi:hypothetical protein
MSLSRRTTPGVALGTQSAAAVPAFGRAKLKMAADDGSYTTMTRTGSSLAPPGSFEAKCLPGRWPRCAPGRPPC